MWICPGFNTLRAANPESFRILLLLLLSSFFCSLVSFWWFAPPCCKWLGHHIKSYDAWDTPWKLNLWNLQITNSGKKMIWTKPPWISSVLIFRILYPLFENPIISVELNGTIHPFRWASSLHQNPSLSPGPTWAEHRPPAEEGATAGTTGLAAQIGSPCGRGYPPGN